MTCTAKIQGEAGKTCIACYNNRRLPKVVPLQWKVKGCFYSEACLLMCTMWRMALKAKVHVFSMQNEDVSWVATMSDVYRMSENPNVDKPKKGSHDAWIL